MILFILYLLVLLSIFLCIQIRSSRLCIFCNHFHRVLRCKYGLCALQHTYLFHFSADTPSVSKHSSASLIVSSSHLVSSVASAAISSYAFLALLPLPTLTVINSRMPDGFITAFSHLALVPIE